MRTLSGMLPGQPGRKSDSKFAPEDAASKTALWKHNVNASHATTEVAGVNYSIPIVPQIRMQAGPENVVVISDDMLG